MNDLVVFFDLYDTLTQADRGYLKQYFDAELDKLGDIGILKTAQMTIEKIVNLHPELLKKHTIEEMVQYYEECMNNSLMNIDKNILIMLEELKEKGIGLCIISDVAFVDIAKWNESPLSKYFDKTIFSCEVGSIKPN